MTSDLARLLRWIRRAQPPRSALWRAFVLGFVASATNVALFVGAIALLVESSTRPGLHAVAIVLVVIELFAFLRSPLRFRERLAAHRLGFSAVTKWRRWLVLVVGRWSYSTWRTYGTGDLLERALVDTDELQDLWLRFMIPFVNTCAVMVLGDVVVGSLPPVGHWIVVGTELFVVQLVSLFFLVVGAMGEVRADRELRRGRGNYRAQLIELAAVAPELSLLGKGDLTRTRLSNAVGVVARGERELRRRRRRSYIVIVLGSVLCLLSVIERPRSAPVWTVVAVVVALATYEALTGVRSTLHAAVDVSGGGERLELLDDEAPRSRHAWPSECSIHLNNVTIEEDGRSLVSGATFTVTPGSRVAIVGESGVGKSTLLRVIAALQEPSGGDVLIGATSIYDISEDEIRRHLSYVTSEPGLTRGFALDVLGLGRDTTRQPLHDLGALGVVAERTTRFNELSRGERARVALVRAMVTSPDIYVLDEPTAGLGREETARVLHLLASTSSTVLVATHDRDVIAWCTQVIELRAGLLEVINH